MSPLTIAFIVVAVSILGFVLFLGNITIRKQRQALAGADTRAHPAAGEGTAEPEAESTPAPATSTETPAKAKPAPRPKLTADQLAVSRRQFLNRAWGSSFGLFLGFFGMSSLSFLWPKLTGGFGTKISVGNYDDILAEVGPDNDFKPKFVAEGRFWLTYYEGNAEAPVYLAVGAKDTKLLALYRKCVHLGCSVPHCGTSMLFECPCHGSKYRLNGEYYGGPAPRGLDRFPVTLEGDKVVVDTGDVQEGPPRGVSTWDKFAEPVGAFCVPV